MAFRPCVAVYNIGIASTAWGTSRKSENMELLDDDVTNIRNGKPHILVWLEVGPWQGPVKQVAHICRDKERRPALVAANY